MEITDVEAITLHVPMDRPLHHAMGSFTSRSTVLVRVHTDAGPVGLGEAAYFAGRSGSTARIVEAELRPLLVGEDPRYPVRLWEKGYLRTYWGGRGGAAICAIGGVDIALWDLAGKLAGEPLHRLLGGFADRVRPYASGGYYAGPDDTDRLVREMIGHVDDGFTAVKLKAGWDPESVSDLPDHYAGVTGASLDRDVARVRAVREAVGPDVTLLVDANNGWDAKQTMRFLRRVRELDVDLGFLEEPIPTDDVAGMRRLAGAVDVPIAGCETAYTRFAFRDLIEAGCVDVVQPGMNWAGGITEARRIAELAAAYHRPVVPNSFHSGVDLAAAIHLTCAVPNGWLVEWDRTEADALTADLLREPFALDEDGLVAPPDAPGLGVEVDPAFVDAHRVEPA